MDKLIIDTLSTSFDKKDYINQRYVDGFLSLELEYSVDFKNAKILRDFIEVIGKKMELSDIEVARLVIVTDEMNNNSIEYGTKVGESNIMRVNIKDKYLVIEVEDRGNGKKHRTAKEMEELRAFREKHGYSHHNSIRGRGLFMIITNLVDRLYFKDSAEWGLIVGIEKQY